MRSPYVENLDDPTVCLHLCLPEPCPVSCTQNNALFMRLDSFLERCHDILDLTQTIVQFSKLAKIEVGGTKGNTLTASVKQVFLGPTRTFAKWFGSSFSVVVLRHLTNSSGRCAFTQTTMNCLSLGCFDSDSHGLRGGRGKVQGCTVRHLGRRSKAGPSFSQDRIVRTASTHRPGVGAVDTWLTQRNKQLAATNCPPQRGWPPPTFHSACFHSSMMTSTSSDVASRSSSGDSVQLSAWHSMTARPCTEGLSFLIASRDS